MLFAIICTIINLGSQYGLEKLLSPIAIFQYTLFSFTLVFIIKLLTGTILGFVTKFILDKFVVFKEQNESAARTFRQITLYASFAVITTLIFWSFEIGFNVIFKSGIWDIVGGLIGLAIGYTIKFFLDKKYVFKQ